MRAAPEKRTASLSQTWKCPGGAARARGGGSDIICAGVEGKRKFDAESGKERREEGKMTHFARSMPRLFMPTHTLLRKLAHTSCFGTDDVRRDELPTTGFEDVAV